MNPCAVARRGASILDDKIQLEGECCCTVVAGKSTVVPAFFEKSLSQTHPVVVVKPLFLFYLGWLYTSLIGFSTFSQYFYDSARFHLFTRLFVLRIHSTFFAWDYGGIYENVDLPQINKKKTGNKQ